MSTQSPFIIEQALVMPLRGTLDRFAAGVFKDGVCLGESLLYRDTKPVFYGQPAQDTDVEAASAPGGADRLNGSYLFGGYLFRHYGHFLIETLSRVYALKQYPTLPILFSSTHKEIVPWQHKVFKLLGIRNPIIQLKRPALVDRLVMSAPGFALPNFILQEQIDALGAMPAPPKTDRKLWLSRGSYLGGGLINEHVLHPYLQKMGWHILHPQYYPIRKQIALIASSSRVAGVDGSAFHTVLLAKELRGRFDIFFVRNRSKEPYMRIAEMKGFTQRETMLTKENGALEFLAGSGAERFFKLLDVHAVLDVLQE